MRVVLVIIAACSFCFVSLLSWLPRKASTAAPEGFRSISAVAAAEAFVEREIPGGRRVLCGKYSNEEGGSERL